MIGIFRHISNAIRTKLCQSVFSMELHRISSKNQKKISKKIFQVDLYVGACKMPISGFQAFLTYDWHFQTHFKCDSNETLSECFSMELHRFHQKKSKKNFEKKNFSSRFVCWCMQNAYLRFSSIFNIWLPFSDTFQMRFERNFVRVFLAWNYIDFIKKIKKKFRKKIFKSICMLVHAKCLSPVFKHF